MNAQKLEYFKKHVLKKREEIGKNLDYLKNVVLEETTKEGSGELTAYSFHMADQGTDAMEREKAFMFASRDEKFLKQLDEALLRIDNGTFGVCRTCGKDIGDERMEAVPTTTICFDCKVVESKRK
jgi:RNA polymerase-binding protein DksA